MIPKCKSPLKASIFSAPIGNAYFNEIAFVISTVGAIEPTGVPCNTRFSKASIEQRAPFFVGNLEYASRQVFTTAFSEITSLVKYFLAPSFALSNSALISAAFSSSK